MLPSGRRYLADVKMLRVKHWTWRLRLVERGMAMEVLGLSQGCVYAYVKVVRPRETRSRLLVLAGQIFSYSELPERKAEKY